MKIHIKGGTLIDPVAGTQRQADVFVAAGKVAAIGAAPADFNAAKTIDATGLIVAPGFVDLSARLREPGYEHKATLESEMAAAVAGGVTSLVCPPDTDPVLDEPGLVEMLKFRARNRNQAHVYPLGALTVGLKGQVITEMVELTEAGCIGFTQANVPVTDTQVLLRALQYASTYGYTVWLRPLDAFLAKGGVAASGPVASRLGLSGVPVAAETIALHTLFELMRVTGARVHVARLSSAAGVALVRAAKAEGLPVTCDVGANHLHLIDVDIGYFDAQFRLDPPLRAERDREAIRAALADGTIDAICSDHTPVDDDEKLLPFAEATPGATGLELLLSLTVKWAREAGVPLARALAAITSAPADVLKLPAGRIGEGAPADLCVFDPNAHWRVEPRALKSQGHNTPFLGYELPARVCATLVAGQVAFERR
ncbi:dihydroorotase [Burkholderia pseudomallei]|uniref:Dihydroorotase n=1 Tax=Burkholderia pseudomallei (strain 1026b) TaxID=884204 RepID=A0A0H3HH69_BURP2|nr:dihydroorotase [Burkholderia pseudomallei]KGW52396.1 dihydroorotase [Burkholderia pseudomallei MSHR684]ACQ96021.1 dihydroorotase (DHOase) [Burkholderia pseudomallei MSHR346]AFI65294.1 dihydroorotase [Burkholderia pseudomallei 1026b]AGR72254.1 dihydroorotase [Burkholderia pseudomallei MSHR305]AHE26102.1 dihydroorotase, multifunctional complex type domain protein [Burkholderia pseudomallei NCTC 13178]